MPPLTWTHESKGASVRLDAALAEKAEGISRSSAQRLIREGAVTVDGVKVTRPSYSLVEGQIIEAILPGADPSGVLAVSAPLAIVYSDDHIAVVDKPAGIAVHPGSGHVADTLVNHMLSQFPSMRTVGERDRPGVVHRLDRDTSGLLVFALSQVAYERLVDALKRRSISRTYTALVFGHPDNDDGVVEAPIGRDPGNRTRQAVVSTGKPARTRYHVEKRLGPWSLLKVELETGRMHQVRVHFAAAGYPVAGDPSYGNAPSLTGLRRQFLHASRLALKHPVSQEEMEFRSPLPPDLRTVLDDLERSSPPRHTGTC